MMKFGDSTDAGTYRVEEVTTYRDPRMAVTILLHFVGEHVPHGCDPAMWHVIESDDRVSSGGERMAVVHQEPVVHFAGMDDLEAATEEMSMRIAANDWRGYSAIHNLANLCEMQTAMISRLASIHCPHRDSGAEE